MRSLFSIFFFLGVLLFSTAQNPLRDSIEFYQDDSKSYPDLESRLADLDKSIHFAQEAKDTASIVRGYFMKAAYQEDYSKFPEALKNIVEGRRFAEKKNDSLLVADSYYREAIILFRLEKLEESKKVSEKSIILFGKIKDTIFGKEKNMFHLGYVLGRQGDLDKAEKLYEEILPVFQQESDSEMLHKIYSNLAVIYLRKGFAEKAEPIFENALALDLKEGNKIGAARSFGNLAYAQALLKNYPKAFENYEKSIQIAREEGFDEVLYISLFDMAETYENIGDYKGALDAFKQYHSIRDSVIGFQNSQKITELQVQYATERKELELQESQNQVEKLQQAQEINRQRTMLLGLLLLSLLIIGGLIFYKLRDDARRNSELRSAAEKLHHVKLKNKELESLRLKEQIDYKNSDLTNLAIDITRRNEFSQELVDRLFDIEKLPPEQMKSKIRELRMHTTGQLQVSEDLETLQKNINEIGHEFYQNLDKKIGSLSANDKQLCGMIRLNMSNKEVATIRNISVKSAKMSRYRLRKKLGLTPEEDIVAFLREI